MKHWMFRCDKVSMRISQGLDARLPLYHRTAIRVHLMMCRYCARFYRQMLFLRRMSRLDGDDAQAVEKSERLPEAVRERIKKALHAHLH